MEIVYSKFDNWTFSLSGMSSSAGCGLSNLKDYNLQTKWMSNTIPLTDCALHIDTGGLSSFDTLIIDGQNLSSCQSSFGSIYIQYATEPTFALALSIVPLSLSSDTLYCKFPLTTAKYWRIFFENGVVARPYISNLFLGKSVDFIGTQQFNYVEDNPIYSSTLKKTLLGTTKYVQPILHKSRLQTTLNFTLQNDVFKSEFNRFAKSILGRLFPFYLVNSSKIIRFGYSTVDLNELIRKSYGQNDLKFDFVTQTTSNSWPYFPYDIAPPVVDLTGILETNEIIL